MNKTEYQEMARIDTVYWWFLAKRAYLATMWEKYVGVGKKKILDLGCGTGGVTLFLQHFGNVTAVEKYEPAAAIAKKRGLKVIRGDVARLSFASSSFDVVTLLDVLYHQQVREQVVLKEAYRVLKPGGALIIMDSADPRLWSAHDAAMHAKKRFTLEEIEALLHSHNFSLLKKSYLYFLLYPLAFISRKILPSPRSTKSRIPKVSPFLNALLLLLCRLEARMLSFLSFPIGSSLIVVAKKPL